MILKNNALQELYDTLTYGPITISPYADSPIVKAFKECDEKLSESISFDFLKKLQDRCNNLERSNKALRDDNDKLGDKIIELKKKHDAKSKENATLISANADLSDRLAKLQRNYDRINSLWTSQIQENMELRSKIADLQESKPKLVDYEALRKELDDAKEDRDAWRRRATYAEKDRDLTKRNSDGWKSRATHAEKRYAELRKENTDLSGKIVDLKKRITELQKKGDDLTKKGEDLKKRINSVYGTAMISRSKVFRKDGMYELWNKLREVGDATRSELLGYFSDVCDIDDLVEWELEDFLDEYNAWQKKKEKKEIDCDRCEMKNPTFYFDNHPVKMNTETFTLESTVEIDKDILNTVLGINSKEEEHKLDYGDAVRVPWKSYDYMYIGPEGKHIRLFDPKTHAVVLVSVTDNLTYQGCKIILCDEDDIRKIWKDKKQ